MEGYVENRAFCGNQQSYKVYFVMEFSQPFAQFGTWGDAAGSGPDALAPSGRSAAQSTDHPVVGAYASWPSATHPQTITARIGISYVDLDGARDNLKSESQGKDFSAIRREALTAWNSELSTIEVSGGSADRAHDFLHRALSQPSDADASFSDADGRYLGFDGKIHNAVESGHLIYANYSGWDVYRSQMPLVAMIRAA
jgi:putative alpha-1,2-mannosidase